MKNDCKVALFLVNHNDKSPNVALTGLLPFFKEQGFKTLCFEQDSKVTKKDLFAKLKEQITLYTSPKCVAATEKMGYSHDKAVKTCNGYAEATKAELKLLKLLGKNDISYCAMDHDPIPSEINIDNLMRGNIHRESHMVSTIKKWCEYGNVLGMVGFDHYRNLRDNLIQEELPANNIKGYYIVNVTAPDINLPEALYEKQVRGANTAAFNKYNNGLVVLDLLKDPSLNTTDLVTQDYLSHFELVDTASSDHQHHYL